MLDDGGVLSGGGPCSICAMTDIYLSWGSVHEVALHTHGVNKYPTTGAHQ